MGKIPTYNRKTSSTKFTRPAGAGNFDNMDDYNIVNSIALNQGTIQHTPAVDKDIVNKEYVSDNTHWDDDGAELTPKNERSVTIVGGTTASPKFKSVNNAAADVVTFMLASASYGYFGTLTTHPLYIQSNNSNRIELSSDGDIIFSPNVYASSNTDGFTVNTYHNGIGIGMILNNQLVGGGATTTGRGTGITFKGHDGTNYQDMGGVQCVADGQTIASGDSPGKLRFLTTADGSSNLAVNMTIDEAGIVDILNNVLNMNTHKITNVVDPTADQDAATKKYVDDNAGGFAYYDAIVDSGGSGDYTTLASALSTEGQFKSFFVKRCTLTETTDPICLNGQRIYFDHVVMNLATDQKFSVSGDNIVMEGQLTIAGTGDSALDYRILNATGDRNDLSACSITLEPDYSASHSSSIFCAALAGDYNYYKVQATNFEVNTTAGYVTVICVGTHNKHDIKLDLINTTNTTYPRGILSQGDYSTYIVSLQNLSDDTANTTYGIAFFPGANYNSVIGTSRDCDGGNLLDSGTGNKTGELAV